MEFLLHNVICLLQIPASTVLCLCQRLKCDHNMTWPDPYQRMVTGCHPTGYTGRQATSTAAMSPACGPQKLSEMIISTSVTVRSIHDLHHCMATCMRHFDHNPSFGLSPNKPMHIWASVKKKVNAKSKWSHVKSRYSHLTFGCFFWLQRSSFSQRKVIQKSSKSHWLFID